MKWCDVSRKQTMILFTLSFQGSSENSFLMFYPIHIVLISYCTVNFVCIFCGICSNRHHADIVICRVSWCIRLSLYVPSSYSCRLFPISCSVTFCFCVMKPVPTFLMSKLAFLYVIVQAAVSSDCSCWFLHICSVTSQSLLISETLRHGTSQPSTFYCMLPLNKLWAQVRRVAAIGAVSGIVSKWGEAAICGHRHCFCMLSLAAVCEIKVFQVFAWC
jgi:hypothetical protein